MTPPDQVAQCRTLYALAKEYLHGELQQRGFSTNTLDNYLSAPSSPKALNEIYKQLLISAQNANLKTGVISGSLGGDDKIERLGEVLFNFDVKKILSSFDKPEQILDEIEKKLKPNGKILRNTRSIWPQYCKTILSAAKFLAQYKSLKEFTDWADFFRQNPKAYIAAPAMLAHEVHGIGFALACDFFKEIGYTELGKPDIHIRDIFIAFDLCQKNDSDYEVLRALIQFAKNVGVKTYDADKLLWLIGSGHFHLHPKIGKIGNHKRRFIQFAKDQLA